MCICIFFIPKSRAIAPQSIVNNLHGTFPRRLYSPGLHYTVPALFHRLSGTASFFFKWLLLTALLAMSALPGPANRLPHPALTPLNRLAMPLQDPQPSRIDIFNADVRLISACSENTAARRISQCRAALAKQDWQKLTIREYCEYYGYDYPEILKLLKLL